MTDAEFKAILEDEWQKRRPPIPMGERRISLVIACMRRAYNSDRAKGFFIDGYFSDRVKAGEIPSAPDDNE